MDPLDPGRSLVSMDQDPGAEAYREAHTPVGPATVDQGSADRARRTDQSNVLEAVRSLIANHNRARRSAKPAGSLPVAEHRLLERLVLECHTGKPLPAAMELVRRDTAEIDLER
jgi:hypothetical protein